MTTSTNRKKMSELKEKSKSAINKEQKALVNSLRGSMPTMKLTVDKYLREKYAETDAENCE